MQDTKVYEFGDYKIIFEFLEESDDASGDHYEVSLLFKDTVLEKNVEYFLDDPNLAAWGFFISWQTQIKFSLMHTIEENEPEFMRREGIGW